MGNKLIYCAHYVEHYGSVFHMFKTKTPRYRGVFVLKLLFVV